MQVQLEERAKMCNSTDCIRMTDRDGDGTPNDLDGDIDGDGNPNSRDEDDDGDMISDKSGMFL